MSARFDFAGRSEGKLVQQEEQGKEGVQSLAQKRQRFTHTRLHGLYGNIQQLGNFSVFHSFEAIQIKNRVHGFR